MQRGLVRSAFGPFGRVWKAYEEQLEKRPYLVQSATSMALWAAGDMLAQKYGEHRKTLDWHRTLATGCFGATLIGPVGHWWYTHLDIHCRRMFRAGTPAFLGYKVAVDTCVLGPFYVWAFFLFGSFAIDRSGYEGYRKKMEVSFWPTLAAEISFWPFAQLANFTAVPVRHQLLVVNMVTIVDAAFMSWARSQDDWLALVMAYLHKRGEGH